MFKNHNKMLKYYGNLEDDISDEGHSEVQVCLDEVNRGYD